MRKLLWAGVLVVAGLLMAAPHPALADSCSATKTCSGGTTKSCNGTSSCLLGSNYAQCDGTKYYCPSSCTAQYECPYPEYDPYVISCSSSTGSCSVSSYEDSVTCGSTTRRCSECGVNYPCILRQLECWEVVNCQTNSDCGQGGFCTTYGSCVCP